MRAALARHDEILRAAIVAHGGRVFKHTGDGLCAVFSTAPAAVAGAQRALCRSPVPSKRALGETAFAAACDAGRAMSLREAISFALAQLEGLTDSTMRNP